jgi:hypothetical protein
MFQSKDKFVSSLATLKVSRLLIAEPSNVYVSLCRLEMTSPLGIL